MSKEKKVTLRFAEEEDCREVYDWRNDSRVRAISFSSEEIPYEDHEQWFKKMIRDPNRILFIIMNEEFQTIGDIRFDKKGNYSLINIVIGWDFVGKGYGTSALAKASKTYLDNFSVDYIVAEIKKDNIPSIKSFSNAGYQLCQEDEEKAEYRFYGKNY